MEQSAPIVIAQECITQSGDYIGVLTLNKPKALNALDLEMADILLDTLNQWQARDDIACVVLKGAGDKAFCAGGDIVSMYNAMRETEGQIPDFLEQFFKLEYTLDYTIHHYKKPFIVWGSGIVMGGGMGLLCGASHRVITETSRLAMPEISIGLYPDVGGSYFLPRLPGKVGLFLGLTGGHMNGADAHYVGLADHLVAAKEFDTMLSELQKQISANGTADEIVTHVLNHLDVPAEKLTSPVSTHREAIDTWCEGSTTEQVVNNILNADMGEDKWLVKAQKTLKQGSPITAHLVFEQCRRGATMSLADCFKMEAIMSCRCGESGEFQEGVRALLIDKDLSPQWQYSRVEDVPETVVEHFFTSPWDTNSHPLANIGE